MKQQEKRQRIIVLLWSTMISIGLLVCFINPPLAGAATRFLPAFMPQCTVISSSRPSACSEVLDSGRSSAWDAGVSWLLISTLFLVLLGIGTALFRCLSQRRGHKPPKKTS